MSPDMQEFRKDEYIIELEEKAEGGDKLAKLELEVMKTGQRIEVIEGRESIHNSGAKNRIDSLENLTKSRLECHARHILDTEKKVDASVKLSVVSLVIVFIHIIVNHLMF